MGRLNDMLPYLPSYWSVSVPGSPGVFYEFPLGQPPHDNRREIVLISTFSEVSIDAMYLQIARTMISCSFDEVHLIEDALLRHKEPASADEDSSCHGWTGN